MKEKVCQFVEMGILVFLLLLFMVGCQNENEEIQNSDNALSVMHSEESTDSVIAEREEESESSEIVESEQSAQPASETMEAPLEEESQLENAILTEPRLTLEEIESLNAQQIIWGPGTNFDEKNRSEVCVAYQDFYGSYDAWFIGPEKNEIYLTFDEGYENGFTADILDTLQEKQVPAVFFVTMDYVQDQPELVQRMIDEGHIVGNHSTTHPNMTTLSIEEAEAEIMELHEYVKEHFNYEMFLFRAPEGAFSHQSLAIAQYLGYQSVLWSFAYNDWNVNAQMDPSNALDLLCERLHPGAIYLLHAVSETNATILGDFIEETRAQGYEFCTFE